MRPVAYREEQGCAYSPALCVRCEYIHKDRIKALGGRWNPAGRCWELPYNTQSWQSVLMAVPGIQLDGPAARELSGRESDLGRAIPEGIAPMPLREGVSPYRHQWEAYCDAVAWFEREGGIAHVSE